MKISVTHSRGNFHTSIKNKVQEDEEDGLGEINHQHLRDILSYKLDARIRIFSQLFTT